jgi:hypothetical protein
MTLTDVLGSLNQQTTQPTSDTITGLAAFAEADENTTISGSFTATLQTPPGWGQSTWGAAVWQ